MKVFDLLQILIDEISTDLAFGERYVLYIIVSVSGSISFVLLHGDDLLYEAEFSIFGLIHGALSIEIRQLKSYGDVLFGQVFWR